MANYPDNVYAPREKENASGILYEPEKKTVGFAEDLIKLDEEVVALETYLINHLSGTNTGDQNLLAYLQKTTETQEIYVEITGSDITGDGSEENPYQTRDHAYIKGLPDMIENKIRINCGIGTHYGSATLKGKLIGPNGYLKIKGHVTVLDDNGGANYTCNANSLKLDANGRGYWEVTGTPFTPGNFDGKWLQVINSTSDSAIINEKYYPIKTNGNNYITTPIIIFAPTNGITKFKIVEFDTIFSGADPVHTKAPQNTVETIDNLLTPSHANELDGLYTLAPLEYEAINIKESNGAGIMGYNSNFTVQGIENYLSPSALAIVDGNQTDVTQILVDTTAELVVGMGRVNIGNNSYNRIVSIDDATHFTIDTTITVNNNDNVIYYPWAPAIYAIGGFIKSYGIYTYGNAPGQYIASDNATIYGMGIHGNGATRITTGTAHYYGIQALDNSKVSTYNFDIYGAAGNSINAPFYSYGPGSYNYIGQGRVDYSTRIIRTGGQGFSREVYADGIYGANVTHHISAESGGAANPTNQANLTLTGKEWVVDDASLIIYYTNGEYLTITSEIVDDSITANTDTINCNRQKIRLTANASYTMVSTPTIVTGKFEGQTLMLANGNPTNEITLQTNNALPGSLLSLKNNLPFVLAGGWIKFIWVNLGGTKMWAQVDCSEDHETKETILRITSVTSSTYNIQPNDCWLSDRYTNTGAAEVRLPAITAVNHGQVYHIKDADYNATTNNLTINKTGTDTIDKADTKVISVNGDCVTVIANNTTKNWETF